MKYTTAIEVLDNLRVQGTTLTVRSLKLLDCAKQNYVDFILTHKDTPLKRQVGSLLNSSYVFLDWMHLLNNDAFCVSLKSRVESMFIGLNCRVKELSAVRLLKMAIIGWTCYTTAYGSHCNYGS